MLVTGAVSGVSAEVVDFSGGWKSVDFRRIPKTEYSFGGSTLGIKAARSSSVIYKAVPEASRQATQAAWDWSVQSSVPATNLAQKGGDDRR